MNDWMRCDPDDNLQPQEQFSPSIRSVQMGKFPTQSLFELPSEVFRCTQNHVQTQVIQIIIQIWMTSYRSERFGPPMKGLMRLFLGGVMLA